MDPFVFTHNIDASRYELTREGRLVSVLDYRDNGSVVSLTRAFTVPTERGHGYAAEVTARAVDAIETDGKKILPVCWYVGDWFAAHPDRAHLLG